PGDAGLAMAVLGPVLAALVARRELRRLSWLALLPVLALGVLANFAGLPSQPASGQALLVASLFGFIVAFLVVAHSAHRINAAYEVHDKAQINAYRHLIEHVQDAVLRFTPDGAVMLASRSSETLFGCPRYQIAGGKLSDRLHVMDRPNFLTAFANAAEDGRSRTIEVRLRQDDPRARSNVPRFVWAEMQLSPIVEDG